MSTPARMTFAGLVLAVLAGPVHATTAGHLFKSSTAAAPTAINEGVTGSVSTPATSRLDHGVAPVNRLAPVIEKPQTVPAH